MHLERRTDYDRHTAFIVPIFLVCFVLVIGVFTGGVLILNKNSPKKSTADTTPDTSSATQEKKNKQPQRVPLARLLSVLSGRKAMRESMVVETTIIEPPAITVTSASLPADLHRAEPIEDEKAHVRAFSTLAPRHEFLRLPIAGRQRVDDHDENDRQSADANNSTEHEGSDEDSALSAIWDSFCASGEGRLHELRTLSYLSFGEQAASKYDEATKGRLGGDDVYGLSGDEGLRVNDAYDPPVGVNEAPKTVPASPLPPPGLSTPYALAGLDPDVKTHSSLMSSDTLVVYPALSRSATLPKGCSSSLPKGCSPPLVSPPPNLDDSPGSHTEISYWSPEKKPRSRWALELFGRANGKKELGRGSGKQAKDFGKQEKENVFKTEPILPLSFDIPDENYVPPGSEAHPFSCDAATRSSLDYDFPVTAVFCPAATTFSSASTAVSSFAASDTPTITLTATDSMDEVAECLANVTVDSSDLHGVEASKADESTNTPGDKSAEQPSAVRRISLQPRRRSLARAPAVRKDIFAV
ncbi:hypothetical protein FB107DRAFT_216129 [Schizophyllum commune]